MPWIEHLDAIVASVAPFLELLLEAIAIVCVACGLVASLRLIVEGLTNRDRESVFADLRLRFGRWLVLALEFQLAGDIVATTVAPTTEALIKLAAIAGIRTFLNYFLQREMKEDEAAKTNPGP